MRVVHLVPGPERHGVVRHALGLLARPTLAGHLVVRVEDARAVGAMEAAFERPQVRAADLVHVHLTDHLLAPTAGECAELLAPHLASRRVSLTLHDLPQPGDGPARYERRARAYRAMADAAAGVIVASAHEAALLAATREVGGQGRPDDARMPGTPVEIVPLPIAPPTGLVGATRTSRQPTASEQPSAPGAASHDAPTLGVFGYLYPGKGHDDALRAAAQAGIGTVLALGEPSRGHEHLVDELRALAAEVGVSFEITGHLPDAEVTRRLGVVTVPVVPGRQISASGSLGSWISADRRPLVAAGPYPDEIDQRTPGVLTRYGPGTAHETLADAVHAALAEPDSTWIAPGTRVGPTADECAKRYDRLLTTWAEAPR